MHRYRWIVAVLLQLVTWVLAPLAMAAPTHIAATLVAEGPALPGQTVMLAFTMKPDAGWHGYWRNPGDAGLGMTLNWSLPYGTSAGEPLYPVPQALLYSGLMNHVFEHDYAVLVPLRLSRDAAVGQIVPIRVHAQWLACTEQICVPEQADLATQITVGSGANDSRFDAWRAALPAPLGAKASFVIAGKTIRLGVPLPASLMLDRPHLFPDADHVIAYAAPQEFRRKGNLLIVTLQRPDIAAADPREISGVLRLNGAGDGIAFTAEPGAVATGGDLLPDASAPSLPPLPLLLLLALAGGLLLNVMPCVFPILSLKALSLARAGESPADARNEGLAYSAGVVIACAALGGVLLALRAAGQQVGWAFQLQEPGVVVALFALAVTITANLAGLFEMSVPGFAQTGSKQGAFATGLLAAFVATPCTGPFMAAAMGAALLLPVAQAMALFITLGLGIALPFLAIALIPALRNRLPRPGAWMVRFRHAMAVPMGLTAAALAWLCWRLGGSSFALVIGVGAGLLLALLAVAGSRQRAGKSAVILLLAGAVPLLVLFSIVAPRVYAERRAGAVDSLIPSEPFSEAALAKARASEKPVFVYFTADWCLTCKVNENTAIEREETRAAFAKAGVKVLVGDWTRRDPAITRFLTSQGAAGVPLYLWYAPGASAPAQLPQVLTTGLLTEKAAGKAS